MRRDRPRLLIAVAGNAQPLAQALAADFEIATAGVYREAVHLFDELRPRVLMVGYHFDKLRPFRLVSHARASPAGADCSIVLVRVHGLHFSGCSDEEIRQAYRLLGVDEFFNLHEALACDATSAYARLRALLLACGRRKDLSTWL